MRKIFIWAFHVFNLTGSIFLILGIIITFISLNKDLFSFVIGNLLVSLGLTLIILSHTLLANRQNFTIERKLDHVMDTLTKHILIQRKGRAK